MNGNIGRVVGLGFGAKGSRSRWLAAVPLVVALTGAALLLPRGAVPDVVPLPATDPAALAAVVREDTARAERARREGLADDIREFGTLLREWNQVEATADDQTRINAARGALDRALAGLLGKDVERLRGLRAVQLEVFLAEVRRFEQSGTSTGELVAVGGTFLDRMRAVGWLRGRHVLLNEAERRVAYKTAWNGVAGVDRRPDFALSLDETRTLYGLYFRLPHAPEQQIRAFSATRQGAKDLAACDALTEGERLAAEAWRLERINRFASIDKSYPAAYAKGIAQFRMRKFPAAAAAFETFLRDHPDGIYRLKARNFLQASLYAVREEAL